MYLWLAVRNIFKNAKNSLVIIIFIAAITILFYIGNSIIGNTDKNIRNTYIESITGDVVIQKSTETTMSLFGSNTPIIGSYTIIPELPAYDLVMNTIQSESGITGITSQVSGAAYMNLLSSKKIVPLCGIDAESYFNLFPGIILEKGNFIAPGEFGAMITLEKARQIEEESGKAIIPGMPVMLTNGSNLGFKIREVPLAGIFRYKNTNSILNEIVLVDSQTVRILNSINVAGDNDIALSDNILNVFSTDIDDLFSNASQFSMSQDNYNTPNNEFSAEMLNDLLFNGQNDNTINTSASFTGGSWNFIILRLDKSIKADTFIKEINKKLKLFDVKAVNWRIASGVSSIMVLLIQALFNAGIFLMSIACIIAAINVMLISVFKRTREIGTLRAIGASDGYIRFLLLSENLILALAAGLLGIIIGFIFILLINNLGLKVNNELIASLIGGSIIKIESVPLVNVFSIITAIFLGIIASIYPIEAAVRITPSTALRRG